GGEERDSDEAVLHPDFQEDVVRIDAGVSEPQERSERAGAVPPPSGAPEVIDRSFQEHEPREVRGVVSRERAVLEHRTERDEIEEDGDDGERGADREEETKMPAPAWIEDPPERERRDQRGQRTARTGEVEDRRQERGDGERPETRNSTGGAERAERDQSHPHVPCEPDGVERTHPQPV